MAGEPQLTRDQRRRASDGRRSPASSPDGLWSVEHAAARPAAGHPRKRTLHREPDARDPAISFGGAPCRAGDPRELRGCQTRGQNTHVSIQHRADRVAAPWGPEIGRDPALTDTVEARCFTASIGNWPYKRLAANQTLNLGGGCTTVSGECVARQVSALAAALTATCKSARRSARRRAGRTKTETGKGEVREWWECRVGQSVFHGVSGCGGRRRRRFSDGIRRWACSRRRRACGGERRSDPGGLRRRSHGHRGVLGQTILAGYQVALKEVNGSRAPTRSQNRPHRSRHNVDAGYR